MTTRVPETYCLNCGTILDAVSTPDDANCVPTRGDPIACLRCGAVATVGDDGALRPFTEEEAVALLADDETMANLRRAVGAINVLRHSRN
jgi:hypothetical protein